MTGALIEVRYHLDWEWGAAESYQVGWRVTNDQGYEVRVREGYLTSYSLQLAPYPEDLSRGLISPR